MLFAQIGVGQVRVSDGRFRILRQRALEQRDRAIGVAVAILPDQECGRRLRQLVGPGRIGFSR